MSNDESLAWLAALRTAWLDGRIDIAGVEQEMERIVHSAEWPGRHLPRSLGELPNRIEVIRFTEPEGAYRESVLAVLDDAARLIAGT